MLISRYHLPPYCLGIGFGLLLGLLVTFPLAAQTSISSEQTPIIIQLQEEVTVVQFLEHPTTPALTYQKTLLPALRLHLVQPNQANTLANLKAHPLVVAAQEDAIIEWRNSPNDEGYDRQWALEKVQAEQAWETTTGGLSPNDDTIVCAVIDASFDVQHEDLQPNIWLNRAEIPNNGVDDDQNGFVDDYRGWQLVFKTDRHNYGPLNSHGTAILGIIGAKGNNQVGVSGINWDIQMMLLSAHTSAEVTKLSNIIEGLGYILDMRQLHQTSNGQAGAFVPALSTSWGIDYAKASDNPIWCDLYNTLGEAGILTVAASSNNSIDIDRDGDMPCTCTSPYLIAVSESTDRDQNNASYGKQSLDLFAPSASRSTRWGNNYGDFGGTSGAAPLVAGAISLLYSYQHPAWGQMIREQPAQAALLIKSILLNSVDKNNFLEASVSGGRLNVGRAIEQLKEYFSEPEELDILSIHPNPVSEDMVVKISLPEANDYTLNIYNSIGQIVWTKTVAKQPRGVFYIPVDASGLGKGVYVLEFSSATKPVKVLPFVKG